MLYLYIKVEGILKEHGKMEKEIVRGWQNLE